MVILITGGTGFIGSHIAEKLIARGHKVICLIRESSNLQWLKSLPVEFVKGNYYDERSLQDSLGTVDAVIHNAGVVAAKSRTGFFRGNQEITKNLLNAALKYAPNISRFLYVSSLTAIGPSINGKPVDEATSPHPITSYGESKLAAEKEVFSRADKIPVTVIRPAAVYGPRDTATLSFFQSVKRGLIPLVGFSPKYVSLIYVSDVARGIVDSLESEKCIGKAYFIGSEEEYSWRHIGTVAARIAERKTISIKIPEFIVLGIAGISGFFSLLKKKPSVLNFEKGRDMIQKHWTCSVEASQRDFGFQQKVTLEEGISNTFEWYKKQGWL